ncbi:MAG: 4Fe-4S dicluster domain-containing protein [Chloroflexi bacterium]|nr:4Fe-4S dicluster domain-containing protein [Chloroflexota bacterium]
MKTKLTVENGNVRKTLQDFLASLLETGLVELLYLPMRTPSGTVTPALVSSPDMLEYADVLASVMSMNSATQVGKLSIREPRPKIGVVLRSCEMRALVELAKLQQASLADLVTISLDCAGTYAVPEFLEKSATNNREIWKTLYQTTVLTSPQPMIEQRIACQICEQPVYDQADIVIEMIGSDLQNDVRLSVKDELAGQLGLQPVEPGERAAILDKLIENRSRNRDMVFEELRTQMDGSENLTKIFAACIRCHNCMNVCPICYCKTCVFKSEVFDHEPMQYVTWVKQKGAFRMPADTMLFHLTRMNHMVLSCVGCGMCTEACPAELPVGQVFRTIGQRVQTTFDYLPGRSLDEPLPLITFKADEWNEVGEN